MCVVLLLNHLVFQQGPRSRVRGVDARQSFRQALVAVELEVSLLVPPRLKVCVFDRTFLVRVHAGSLSVNERGWGGK